MSWAKNQIIKSQIKKKSKTKQKKQKGAKKVFQKTQKEPFQTRMLIKHGYAKN